MIEIQAPWPSAILSPNSSESWKAKIQPKKKSKTDGYFTGKENPMIFKDGHIPIHIVFYPPDNRHRDADNMLSSLKSFLDGLCQAWGINDKRFRPITIDVGEPVKNGKVLIRL